MENGCRFAFHNNILLTVVDVHFLGFVSEHRTREKEQKNVTLIEHSSPPISAQEIAQLL